MATRDEEKPKLNEREWVGAPVANKKLYTLREYEDDKGGKSIVSEIGLETFGKFYRPCEERVGDPNWHHSWSDRGVTKFVPKRITSRADAASAVLEFGYPPEMYMKIKAAANRLSSLLIQNVRHTPVYDQTWGNLDGRKYSQIVAMARKGQDPNDAKPYKHMQRRAKGAPRVGIAISAGNGEMWGDEQYIPRAASVGLILLWACDAANIPARAFMVEESTSVASAYNKYHYNVELSRTPQYVMPALHADTWRYGCMTTLGAYPGELHAISEKCAGRKWQTSGWSISSYSGGDACAMMRKAYDFQFIVSMGRISDPQNADVHLGAVKDLEPLELVDKLAHAIGLWMGVQI